MSVFECVIMCEWVKECECECAFSTSQCQLDVLMKRDIWDRGRGHRLGKGSSYSPGHSGTLGVYSKGDSSSRKGIENTWLSPDGSYWHCQNLGLFLVPTSPAKTLWTICTKFLYSLQHFRKIYLSPYAGGLRVTGYCHKPLPSSLKGSLKLGRGCHVRWQMH